MIHQGIYKKMEKEKGCSTAYLDSSPTIITAFTELGGAEPLVEVLKGCEELSCSQYSALNNSNTLWWHIVKPLKPDQGLDKLPTTVVPALGDPRRERTPAVCGHFVNVPTHFKVKLAVISGHLPNADADSRLSAPAITDSANKCHVFGGHFNQKSLVRIQTCDRQISQISVLSSGDYDNVCIH